jgi:hypothetical protein
MGALVWRVIGPGSAVLAGILANKAVEKLWDRSGRGHGYDPRDPHAPLIDAVAFAALTGLAVGTARVIAMRRAAMFYEKSSGHLPKALQDRNTA